MSPLTMFQVSRFLEDPNPPNLLYWQVMGIQLQRPSPWGTSPWTSLSSTSSCVKSSTWGKPRNILKQGSTKKSSHTCRSDWPEPVLPSWYSQSMCPDVPWSSWQNSQHDMNSSSLSVVSSFVSTCVSVLTVLGSWSPKTCWKRQLLPKWNILQTYENDCNMSALFIWSSRRLTLTLAEPPDLQGPLKVLLKPPLKPPFKPPLRLQTFVGGGGEGGDLRDPLKPPLSPALSPPFKLPFDEGGGPTLVAGLLFVLLSSWLLLSGFV